MILLADANILLDFGWVGGLDLLCALGPLEVLDTVFLEAARDPQLPTLREDLERLGVRFVETQPEWHRDILALKRGKLSLQDASCLFHGQQQRRTVLTNEGPLRKRCGELQVEVHGSLWVVTQLHARGLCETRVLCRWLHLWVTEYSAFLPATELERLRHLLGC